MDKKKCIITGSNGYLGKQLSVIFKKYGWQVVELSSSNKDDQFNFNLKNLENFKYNVLEKCNLLIHTAYDFSASNLEKSISTNSIYEMQSEKKKKFGLNFYPPSAISLLKRTSSKFFL